jgi:ABC-type nitrate/sulfonate/bicarbonate transport system permease component
MPTDTSLTLDASRRAVPFRGGGFVISPRPLAPFLSFALVLAFWEAASRLGWLDPLTLPAPSAIGAALYEITANGTLWKNMSISLWRILVGWSVGTLLGVMVGIMMGVWSLSRAVGLSFVSALFPIPKVALLPLFILWMGIGETSKIATIALGVFFPTTISVYTGIDSVPRNLIRMAQSFDVPAAQILWKVVLPGALPNIIGGFRISSSIALILLVSAEMIGAEFGIGAYVLQTGNMMMTEQLLAGVTALSVIGLCISWLLSWLERVSLRWR